MKKLALTNLVVLLFTKLVSACDRDPRMGPAPPPFIAEKYVEFFFFGTFILFVPIIVFYAASDRQRKWIVIAAGLVFLLYLPAVFIAAIAGMCDPDNGAYVVVTGFGLMAALLFLQIAASKNPKKPLE